MPATIPPPRCAKTGLPALDLPRWLAKAGSFDAAHFHCHRTAGNGRSPCGGRLTAGGPKA